MFSRSALSGRGVSIGSLFLTLGACLSLPHPSNALPSLPAPTVTKGQCTAVICTWQPRSEYSGTMMSKRYTVRKNERGFWSVIDVNTQSEVAEAGLRRIAKDEADRLNAGRPSPNEELAAARLTTPEQQNALLLKALGWETKETK